MKNYLVRVFHDPDEVRIYLLKKRCDESCKDTCEKCDLDACDTEKSEKICELRDTTSVKSLTKILEGERAEKVNFDDILDILILPYGVIKRFDNFLSNQTTENLLEFSKAINLFIKTLSERRNDANEKRADSN